MGSCCCKVPIVKKISSVNPKKVTLLILGLDNAGKTTIVRRLTKQSLEDVVPTVGFAACDLQQKGCNISLYDIGGGPKIRDIWKQYYADVHGVIFVVDSNDILRVDECRLLLTSVLTHPKISGKPLLLLANKQDVEGALDEIDIVEKMRLEALVNQQKCPTLVELCAAKIAPDKTDLGIDNGFKWLLRNVTKDYPTLNNRVLVDMAEQEEVEKIAMDKRKEKLRNSREDRLNEIDTLDDNEIDPFKPISQIVQIKPISNGHVPHKAVPVDPDVGEEEDDNDDDIVIHSQSTKSELFFKSQDWSSTSELLESLPVKKFSEFVQRPKSSGALEFKIKKRIKKKRRLRFKNNKTEPVPMGEMSRPKLGPLPAIFDPSYHTQITLLNGNSERVTKLPQSGELLLNASNLSRKV